MRLAYYQNPELQMFDAERCEQLPSGIWDGFNADNIDHVRIYKGDTLQQLDRKEKMLAMVSVTSHVSRDIALGKFAERKFKIYYVSQTFWSAMEKSFGKLRHLMDEKDAMRTAYEDAVFVVGDFTQVFVRLKDDQFRFMLFDRGRLAHLSDFSVNDDAEERQLKYADMDTMTVMQMRNEGESFSPILTLYIQSFILFFKKYGNVDVQMVEGNTTARKSLLGEKVNNYTGIDVQLLDSRWFTTICREEGFLVSGHFRLQPCKDEQGEWTRKLIYIKPFAKHGYHRTATKLVSDETTNFTN